MSRLAHALPLLLGVLVLGLVRAGDGELGRPGSHATLAAVALVLALAHAPGAARTKRATVRRLAILAVLLLEAALAPLSDVALAPTPWTAAEHGARFLALVGAGLELGAFLHERGTPAPTSEPARRRSRLAFGLAVAGLVSLLVPYRLLAPERRVDLASLPHRTLEGHARQATLPLLSPDAAPETAQVLEDGVPLARDNAPPHEIALLGSGRYAVSPRAVTWSSSDGTDPLTSGHRYELVFRPDPHRSVLAEVGFALAALLLLGAWSVGAFDLEQPSPHLERALVLGLVGLALGASLPGRWNQVVVAIDTQSYVAHAAVRSPLYPAFLDLFDARPPGERPPLRADSDHAHVDAANPLLGAVRAQKVLTIVAALVLLLVLARTWNAWLLAALAWVVVQADLAATGDGGVAFNATSLMTEGLDQPLVYLYAAAAVAYLARPGWAAGLALAGLFALLLLLRPANAALAVVFPWLLARHLLGSESVPRSLLRVLALGLVAALPLLGACARTHAATGYFRLHAFTGLNVFCTSFDLATEDDLEAFPEPDLHDFVARCLRRAQPLRARLAPGEELFVNLTAHEIALPVLGEMGVLPAGPRHDFVADDMLLAVGKRLVRRHPLGFLRLALDHVRFGFEPWLHGPLALACALGFFALRRERSPALLGLLFLATLPVVAILPSCAFNFPILRYRAPLLWVELGALPLFVALLIRTRKAR